MRHGDENEKIAGDKYLGFKDAGEQGLKGTGLKSFRGMASCFERQLSLLGLPYGSEGSRRIAADYFPGGDIFGGTGAE